MTHCSINGTLLQKWHPAHSFCCCTFIQILYIYANQEHLQNQYGFLNSHYLFLLLLTTVPWYILTYVYGDFYARGRAAMLFSAVYGGRLVESYNSCLVDRSLSQEWGQFRDFWQFLVHSVVVSRQENFISTLNRGIEIGSVKLTNPTAKRILLKALTYHERHKMKRDAQLRTVFFEGKRLLYCFRKTSISTFIID